MSKQVDYATIRAWAKRSLRMINGQHETGIKWSKGQVEARIAESVIMLAIFDWCSIMLGKPVDTSNAESFNESVAKGTQSAKSILALERGSLTAFFREGGSLDLWCEIGGFSKDLPQFIRNGIGFTE